MSAGNIPGDLKDARKAVQDSGSLQGVIKTIDGRGYQFIAEVTDSTNGQPATETASDLSLPDKPSIAVLPSTTSAL
jgi:DNA-binding winged helix-turn-helix (wHTH) protein